VMGRGLWQAWAARQVSTPGRELFCRFDFGSVIADRPLNPCEEVLEHLWMPIDLVVVAERGVENASFFPWACPGNPEVAVSALDAIDVHVGFFRVQAQQHVDCFGVVGIFVLIDFFFELDVLAFEHGDERVIFLAGLDFDADESIGGPWVAVEVTVDHGAVFGPFVAGVGGGVDADEAFAGFDEGHQIFLQNAFAFGGGGLLLVVEGFEFLGVGEENIHGGAQEADGIELVEALGFKIFEVVTDGDLEGSGVFAHLFEGDFAGGDGCVAEAIGLGEDEEFPGFLWFGVGFVRQGGGDFFKSLGRSLFTYGVLCH